MPEPALRRLAMKGPQDWDSRAANEWYWVRRFGHPLFDAIITGVFANRYLYAEEITEAERRGLTRDDLDVLARSPSPMARKVAAEHQSCPPEAAALLSEDYDAEVRKAVGHNPSTPAAVIDSMRSGIRRGAATDEIDEHRAKFLWMELDHVAPDHELALEIARDPRFRYEDEHRRILASRRPSAAVRIALAENHATPSEVLLKLLEDSSGSVRAAAGVNSSLLESARLRVLSDKDEEVRRSVIVRGSFSDAVVQSWDNEPSSRGHLSTRLCAGPWIWGKHRDWDSEAVLRALALSPHVETRAAVARHERTPIDVLEQLADDNAEWVRKWVEDALEEQVAHERYLGSLDLGYIWWYRRELDEAELAQLVQSDNPRLRKLVARRLDDGLDLRPLVVDPDSSVRSSVASHPWIGFDNLIRLVEDPDEDVRRSAAAHVHRVLRVMREPRPGKIKNWLKRQDLHPDIPQERGGRLDMQRVRLGNPRDRRPSWPDDALDRLARVENEQVRRMVASYSGSYDASMGKPNAALHDLSLSSECLAQLLHDSNADVRSEAMRNSGPAAVKVAADPDTPLEALIRYARSRASTVRCSVAANPATPRPVLANLARDPDVAVRRAVAGNQATPGDALTVLGEDHDGDQEDRDKELVLELLGNPSSPAALLEREITRISYPFMWVERERRLARNPGSPEAVLSQLAFSKWADVREAVAGHPNTPRETLEVLALDEHGSVRRAATSRGITGIE